MEVLLRPGVSSVLPRELTLLKPPSSAPILPVLPAVLAPAWWLPKLPLDFLLLTETATGIEPMSAALGPEADDEDAGPCKGGAVPLRATSVQPAELDVLLCERSLVVAVVPLLLKNFFLPLVVVEAGGGGVDAEVDVG